MIENWVNFLNLNFQVFYIMASIVGLVAAGYKGDLLK